LLVCNSNTTSGCVCCKLPWRISQNNVELCFCCQCLGARETMLTQPS
jgi:hypothetical protein